MKKENNNVFKTEKKVGLIILAVALFIAFICGVCNISASVERNRIDDEIEQSFYTCMSLSASLLEEHVKNEDESIRYIVEAVSKLEIPMIMAYYTNDFDLIRKGEILSELGRHLSESGVAEETYIEAARLLRNGARRDENFNEDWNALKKFVEGLRESSKCKLEVEIEEKH